jgi:hypothetical protein
LVSDIPAGDGKTANIFYSVGRVMAKGTRRRKTTEEQNI